jgi:hypothetical protein
VTKLIRIEWVGHAPSLGEMKNSCGVLVEKPEVINWEIMLWMRGKIQYKDICVEFMWLGI